jgi:hypothetical protein
MKQPSTTELGNSALSHDTTRQYPVLQWMFNTQLSPHLKIHTLCDRIGAKTETVLPTLLLEMGSYKCTHSIITFHAAQIHH